MLENPSGDLRNCCDDHRGTERIIAKGSPSADSTGCAQFYRELFRKGGSNRPSTLGLTTIVDEFGGSVTPSNASPI